MSQPLVSVVVPVFDVEDYVDECLASLANQTVRELEVVVVDNGSTDRTADRVRRWADRDDRFRLVSVEGGGPGRARNAGMNAARGEFLAFADGDDVVPGTAYERLLGALRETRSEFAAGNFLRLTEVGVRPAHFMGSTFARQRLRTHIRDFRDLIADRTVWNKLYRREFLDRHQLSFAELGAYEDQHLSLPAYFLANAVDVLSDTVYFWRVRESGGPSLSQQRETPEGMARRLIAVSDTSAFLRAQFRAEKGWYEQSVVQHDLTALPRVLAAADPEARAPVVDQACAWLDQSERGTLDVLPSRERIAWELIRRRAVDELGDLYDAKARRLAPVRRFGRWYADSSLPASRHLRLPRRAFRIDDELALSSRIDAVDVTDGRVRVTGFARVDGLPLPAPDSHELSATAIGVASSKSRIALTSTVRARPDLAMLDPEAAGEWGGFQIVVDPTDLRSDDGALGAWQLELTARRRGLVRTTSSHGMAALHAVRPIPIVIDEQRQLRIELAGDGRTRFVVEARGPVLTGLSVNDAEITLTGSLPGDVEATGLQLRGAGGLRLDVPIESPSADATRFTATVPMSEVCRDFADRFGPLSVNRPQLEVLELAVAGAGRIGASTLDPSAPTSWIPGGGHEWSLARNRRGLATLVQRAPRPTVSEVELIGDGDWLLTGRLGGEFGRLALVAGDGAHVDLGPMSGDPFSVTLPAAHNLALGTWQLQAGRGAAPAPRWVPVSAHPDLITELPRWSEPGAEVRSVLGIRGHDGIALFVAAGQRR